MVAASSRLVVDDIRVTVEGDLDLRGTLVVTREAPIGFAAIRLRFKTDAPALSDRERRSLATLTERYCTVLQTLMQPPARETS